MPDFGQSFMQIKGLSYSYPGNKHPVISCLNAKVSRGEFIAIIGPNGSGKSTLARLMAGLLQPTSGSILFEGQGNEGQSVDLELRDRVGLVMQNPDNQLVAALVEEDVAFGPENLNLPPEEVRLRVNFALKAVGLNHLSQRPPHLLSGGEKQRLAIAGILALNPSCLVLDEPTSMLDPVARQGVLKVLRNLADSGTAVVMITHHMDEASSTDRIWVLGDGEIVIDNNPAAVFKEYELLQKLGLSLPPTIELVHFLAGLGTKLPEDIVTMEDMVDYLCRVLK